jgi:TolB protein
VDYYNTIIAYTSVPIGAVNPQIWTVKTNGTLPSQLRIGEQPNMCSDGSKIVFVRKNPSTRKYQIWLMNSDGTGETLLSQDPNVNDRYPYFSPDCQSVVFTSDAGGNNDIYIMKIDGSQRTQLTTNPSVDIYPVWGDNGYIYFVSNRGLIWGIWALKPALNESE